MKRENVERVDFDSLIANRYRIEETLGQGGMAVVYKVTDTSKHHEVALKRPLIKQAGRLPESVERLFENEFHTLAQLAHPRVVEVYDYGVDDSIPFYTMELLGGGDLKSLAPMPWEKACLLLRDVCSVLSLLHSRKQVHRDVSTRNIRCTSDDKAKLFDFGSLRPMGPSKKLIGTPPFTAPEAVNSLSLEERTDLYSLGATAYYILTGKHAYPARSIRELPELWRSQLLAPSLVLERRGDKILPPIPKELDNLVMSMLRLPPIARPASAGEVIDKLNAIAGLTSDEPLYVTNAYLSTPTLIGRNKEVSALRKQMLLARVKRGHTTLIEGVSGVGRSRFLEAHILEGKLVGATVVRIDASDAYSGPYGGVKALIAGLKDNLSPNMFEASMPYLNRVFRVNPELDFRPVNDRIAETKSDLPPGVRIDGSASRSDSRSRLQEALGIWLRAISNKLLLMIAVDDVHKLDEPSAAFLAYLSRVATSDKLVLSVTAEKDAPGSSEVAMRVFRTADTRIVLEPMDLSQTEALFSSVFGQVPNVRLLSDRIYSICKGNPRDALQLARHLLDKGVIQYQSGAWSLPASIDPGDLPKSMFQALKEQIDGFNDVARQIVECMSLEPEQVFTQPELLTLSGLSKPHLLLPHLDRLIAAEVLQVDGDHYRLVQKGLGSTVRSHFSQVKEKALRLRLAEMFESQRGDRFRMAQHLLRAGEEERAIAILAESSETSHEHTSKDAKAYIELAQSVPEDLFETFQFAIDQAKQKKYSPKQIYELQNRFLSLCGTGIVRGSGFAPHYIEILNQLYRIVGLDIYHQLDESMEPTVRLKKALELAQNRYTDTPEPERVIEPITAIRRLGRSLMTAASSLGISYDYSFWEVLPSIVPLTPLSPALGIVESLVRSMGDRIAARDQVVRRLHRQILDQSADPKRAGMDETYRTYMRFALMNGLGFIEGAMGLRSALSWADEIESDPSYEVNAWRIRRSYHLWQGDSDQADLTDNTVEFLQIQNTSTQWYEGSHLHRDLVACALSNDLTRVKQSIDAIEKFADIHPAWKPTLYYAQGQYQRIRGDAGVGLSEFEKALQLSAPGRNPGWCDFAGAYLTSLLELGRNQQALEQGRQFLTAAKRAELDYHSIYIQMPLALAESSCGYYDDAVANADTVIRTVTAEGATGLNLLLAHETRARVAIDMGDSASFEDHAERCLAQLKKSTNRSLIDKYERLVARAHAAGIEVISQLVSAIEMSENIEAEILNRLSELLSACNNPIERHRSALDFLVDQASCLGGFLYLMQDNQPVLVAQNGQVVLPDGVLTMVEEEIAREMASEAIEMTATMTATEENTAEMTVTEAVDTTEMVFQNTEYLTGTKGELLYPMILSHHISDRFYISGAAVLAIDPQKEFRLPTFLSSTLSRMLSEFE